MVNLSPLGVRALEWRLHPFGNVVVTLYRMLVRRPATLLMPTVAARVAAWTVTVVTEDDLATANPGTPRADYALARR